MAHTVGQLLVLWCLERELAKQTSQPQRHAALLCVLHHLRMRWGAHLSLVCCELCSHIVSCGPTAFFSSGRLGLYGPGIKGLLYFQVSFAKPQLSDCLWLRKLRPRGDHGPGPRGSWREGQKLQMLESPDVESPPSEPSIQHHE